MVSSRASGDLPIIQIWHPSSLNSTVYNKIGQAQVTNITRVTTDHYIAICNSSELEFQSGDVLGYYQSLNSSHLVWNTWTIGYSSYVSNSSNAFTTTVDLMNLTKNYQEQPLIKMTFGEGYKSVPICVTDSILKRVTSSLLCVLVCVYIYTTRVKIWTTFLH